MCVDTRANNCWVGHLGLAVAVCSKGKGLLSLVLERFNCIASLWKLKTYDQLILHFPKKFCGLPFMSFPKDFPTYPSKQQYVQYLEAYAKKFNIRPVFNTTTVIVEYE
ncbi:indole-3-pyruvate monooxygenase YUCCA6-like, partial [Olea europaea subsp. europaea]